MVTFLRFRVDSDWKVPRCDSEGTPGAATSPDVAAAASLASAVAASPASSLGTCMGTISASATKGRAVRTLWRMASTTSGYLAVIASSLRENRVMVPSALRCTWARCPSYLCSAATHFEAGDTWLALSAGALLTIPPAAPRSILIASTMEVHGLASMGCNGTPTRGVHAACNRALSISRGSPAPLHPVSSHPESTAATRTATSGRSA